MKKILIFCAILFAPWPVFGQQFSPNPVITEVEPASIAVLAQQAPVPVPVPIPIAVLAQQAPVPIQIAVLAQIDSGATAIPASPDVGELLSDAGKVIDDWGNVGWLAGVIALINLLLNLLRFTPINALLADLDYKWTKPLTATLLGAALGGFSTFSTGASALQSIIAGAMAGLGSVGFHELIDKTRKRTTKIKVQG